MVGGYLRTTTINSIPSPLTGEGVGEGGTLRVSPLTSILSPCRGRGGILEVIFKLMLHGRRAPSSHDN